MTVRFRNYMVTTWVVPTMSKKFQYMVYQTEKCPTTGTIHYQCYVECKDKMSLEALKKAIGDESAHVEPRKGNQDQAIIYCTKSETRVGEPIEQGNKKHQGNRSDLDSIVEAVEAGWTSREILIEFKGNALRHISHINKCLEAYWDCSPIDSLIRGERLRTQNRNCLPPVLDLSGELHDSLNSVPVNRSPRNTSEASLSEKNTDKYSFEKLISE